MKAYAKAGRLWLVCCTNAEIKAHLWHDLGHGHMKLPSDWLPSDTAFAGQVVCWMGTCVRVCANSQVQGQHATEKLACGLLYTRVHVSLTATRQISQKQTQMNGTFVAAWQVT